MKTQIRKFRSSGSESTWIPIVDMFLALTVTFIAVAIAVGQQRDDARTDHDRAAEENRQLAEENHQLKDQLSDHKKLLRDWQRKHKKLETELKKTQQELTAAEQDLASAKDKIAILQSDLEQTKTNLAQTRRDLEQTNSILAQMRRDLDQAIAKLNAAQSKIALLTKAKSELEAELLATNKAINELRVNYKNLLTRYEELLAATRKSQQEFAAEIAQLKKQLADAAVRIKILERELARRIRMKPVPALPVPVPPVPVVPVEPIDREQTIRQEILGLKGDLSKVAILFDCSASMKKSGRWEHAVEVVKTWLHYLNFKECVLIRFNSHVTQFPGDGTLLAVDTDAGRKRLLDQLAEVQAEGRTHTLTALRRAYWYAEKQGCSTILLFTDGAPNTSTSEFNDRVAQDIYDLCAEHPGVKVNTIGLGNYFEEGFANFLIQLARKTGGEFIGR